MATRASTRRPAAPSGPNNVPRGSGRRHHASADEDLPHRTPGQQTDLRDSRDIAGSCRSRTASCRRSSSRTAILARAAVSLALVHVQPKYAMTADEARRVIAEHGWARVVTCGGEGLRATYGFFLLEEGDAEQVVVVGHFARADPAVRGHRGGYPGPADLRGAARIRLGVVVPPGADRRPEHDESPLGPRPRDAAAARRRGALRRPAPNARAPRVGARREPLATGRRRPRALAAHRPADRRVQASRRPRGGQGEALPGDAAPGPRRESSSDSSSRAPTSTRACGAHAQAVARRSVIALGRDRQGSRAVCPRTE